MKKKTSKPLKWYREIYIKDGYRCVYCGRDMLPDFDDWISIEVDHIVPISKGGNDDLENRVTSCHVCNKFKGSFTPQNYKELDLSEVLIQSRKYVMERRAEWRTRHALAINEFEKAKQKENDSQ